MRYYQLTLDGRREGGAPNDWAPGEEPHAAHPSEASVADPEGARASYRDKFAEAGRAVPQRVGNKPKIGQAVEHLAGELKAVCWTSGVTCLGGSKKVRERRVRLVPPSGVRQEVGATQ